MWTTAVFTCMDALSLACTSDGVQVISTPNMMFVPEPHLDGEELRIRADGRLGPADCFQWPQLYCKEYEYAVCIPRKEFHALPDPLGWAWYTPTLEDFKECATVPGRGHLVESKATGVASLYSVATKRYDSWKSRRGQKKDIASKWVQDLRHTVDLLRNQPLFFRDIIVLVAQAQRSFLDIYSFLEFVEVVIPHRSYPSVVLPSVRTDWMGSFTKESSACNELFSAGVPVWLVRADHTITPRTIIKNRVRFTFPDDILRALYSERGRIVPNPPLLHSGPGGLERHFNSRRQYSPNLASPGPVDPPQVNSQVGKALTHTQTRKAKKVAQTERVRTSKPGMFVLYRWNGLLTYECASGWQSESQQMARSLRSRNAGAVQRVANGHGPSIQGTQAGTREQRRSWVPCTRTSPPHLWPDRGKAPKLYDQLAFHPISMVGAHRQ